MPEFFLKKSADHCATAREQHNNMKRPCLMAFSRGHTTIHRRHTVCVCFAYFIRHIEEGPINVLGLQQPWRFDKAQQQLQQSLLAFVASKMSCACFNATSFMPSHTRYSLSKGFLHVFVFLLTPH